jgi:hypothetical protein
VTDYSNSRIIKVIDEYIHNELYRKILKRRFVDGIVYEKLAEEFEMSVRHVKNVVYTYEPVIFKHL